MERNKKKKNILGFEQVEDEDQKKRYEEEIENFIVTPSENDDDSPSLIERVGKAASKVRDVLKNVVFGKDKSKKNKGKD